MAWSIPGCKERGWAATGLQALDELLGGGFPQGGLVALCGPAGAGPLRLAAWLLVAPTSRGKRACVVDCAGTLYPPGLHAEGVELERLLIVRPPDLLRAARAVEELLRHGGVSPVVVVGLSPGEVVARRLLLAAEAGRSVGVWVGADRHGLACFATRLQVHRRGTEGLEVRVQRRKSGPAGQRALLSGPR